MRPELEKLGIAFAKADYKVETASMFENFIRTQSRQRQLIFDAIKAKGYDGIVYSNVKEGASPADSWMVFSPTQIKSAFNSGKFNGKDANISNAEWNEQDHPRDGKGEFVEVEGYGGTKIREGDLVRVRDPEMRLGKTKMIARVKKIYSEHPHTGRADIQVEKVGGDSAIHGYAAGNNLAKIGTWFLEKQPDLKNADLRNAFDESLHPRDAKGEFADGERFIGYVDSSGSVTAKPFGDRPRSTWADVTHEKEFGARARNADRFRVANGTAQWLFEPTKASAFAAENYFSRNGKQITAHYIMGHGTPIDVESLQNRDIRNAAPAALGINEPLVDAVEHIDAKTPIGTALSSKEIREQWPREFRQRAQFSAKIEDARLLENFQDDLQRAIKGMRDENGALMSRSRFISDNMQLAKQYGLDTGTKGITNPASIGRLGLVFDTQTSMAAGYANKRMGEQELDVSLEPCWELLEDLNPDVPRGTKLVKGELVDDEQDGWPARFAAACEEANDDEAAACLESTGRMVARKDSDVWQALGDGAGGYEDTLGNDFSPFAFNSGMRLFGVDRATCESLGFDISDIAPPDESRWDDGDQEPDDDGSFNDGLDADLSDMEPTLAGAVVESLADYAAFDAATGILKWIGNVLFNRDAPPKA